MKFCSKCGKELECNAAFCPSCGNKTNEMCRKIKNNTYFATKKYSISLLLVVCAFICVFLPGVDTIFSSSYSIFKIANSSVGGGSYSIAVYILLLSFIIDGIILSKFIITNETIKSRKLVVFNIILCIYSVIVEFSLTSMIKVIYGYPEQVVEGFEIGAILLPIFLIACCICLLVRVEDNNE